MLQHNAILFEGDHPELQGTPGFRQLTFRAGLPSKQGLTGQIRVDSAVFAQITAELPHFYAYADEDAR